MIRAALGLLALILVACAPVTPTGTPTTVPTVAKTATVEPTASATITPEASPTLEVWVRCVPDSYAYLDEYAVLYKDEDLIEPNITDEAIFPEVWKDQPVFLKEYGTQRSDVRWVMTATNIVLEGYLDIHKLPADCR